MNEYDGYDIKQLWQMVDAARQGLQPSHDQALALDKAQQMLSGHAEALATAREQLAAKWPPETNAASAAYLTELDRLITAVKDTALTCAVNVFHLTTLSDAIVQTHDVLTPLLEEYLANEKSLAKYDEEINAFSAGAMPIPGGQAVIRSAAKLFTSPTVDKGRQAELTQQAQQAMESLSGAAQDGATYIKPPAPYIPPTVRTGIDNDVQELGGSSSGGATNPPSIAPPTRNVTDARRPSSTSHHHDGPTQSTAGGGLLLSGFAPGPTPSAVSPGSAAGSSFPVGVDKSALVPGLVPGLGRPAGALGALPTEGPGAQPRAGLPAQELPRGRAAIRDVEPLRDGVIGNMSGNSESTRGAPSRVNPSGGIIGQQPGISSREASRAGRPNRGLSTLVPQPSQRRGAAGDATGRRWDPNNPWVIDEGVDPVILPEPPPGRIDPGPGIIGIDL